MFVSPYSSCHLWLPTKGERYLVSYNPPVSLGHTRRPLGLKILPGSELIRLGFQLQADGRDAVGEIESWRLDVKLVTGTGTHHEARNVGTEHDAAKAGISSGGVEVKDIGVGGAIRHDRLGVPAADKGAVGNIVGMRDAVLDLTVWGNVDTLTAGDLDLYHAWISIKTR